MYKYKVYNILVGWVSGQFYVFLKLLFFALLLLCVTYSAQYGGCISPSLTASATASGNFFRNMSDAREKISRCC